MNKDNINKKSEIVKKHFAETAKNMILDEGISSVSVRNVAKEAGYAYATIYNHFENLDELLWYTRDIMMKDIADYISRNNHGEIENIDMIIELFKTYIDYFIKNPNIYQFFYFYKLKKSDKKITSINETDEFKNQFTKTFEFLINKNNKTVEEIMRSVRVILFSIHGLLTLYLSDNEELTITELYDELGHAIRLLLE